MTENTFKWAILIISVLTLVILLATHSRRLSNTVGLTKKSK